MVSLDGDSGSASPGNNIIIKDMHAFTQRFHQIRNELEERERVVNQILSIQEKALENGLLSTSRESHMFENLKDVLNDEKLRP